MLSTVFQNDAELAYDWLLKQVNQEYPEYYRFDKALPTAIQSLEFAQKKLLLEHLPDAARHGDLIDQPVNSDVELFKYLLSQDHLREMHLTALPRVTNSLWGETVLVALDAGYTPEEIAQAATRPFFGEFLSQGERADRWQHMRDAFQLRQSRKRSYSPDCHIWTTLFPEQIDEIRLKKKTSHLWKRMILK
jgi:hypothetical protein